MINYSQNIKEIDTFTLKYAHYKWIIYCFTVLSQEYEYLASSSG